MNTVKALSVVAIATFALAACDVDVEKEGELPSVSADVKEGQMPEYEVVKKQEGEMPEVDVDVQSGSLPEVEVRGPDVEVGTKEVELPDSIEVPTIDVETPKENDG